MARLGAACTRPRGEAMKFAFVLALSAVALQTQTEPPLAAGDVIIVSGKCVVAGQCTPPLPPTYEIKVVSPEGAVRLISSDDVRGAQNTSVRAAFAMYAPAPNRMYYVEQRGALLFTPNLRSNQWFWAESGRLIGDIAPLRDGRLLIAFSSTTDHFVELSLDGSVTAVVPYGLRTRSMDVHPDQCTVLFNKLERGNNSQVIGRFNRCTRTEEPDFATLPDRVYSMRILPGGDVLVATLTDVYRLDPRGAIKHTYGLGRATHLALTPDATAFWARVTPGAPYWDNLTDNIVRVSLSDPSQRSVVTLTHGKSHELAVLAVVGEWRAAAVPASRRRPIR
jgi:hypothetical protein